MTGFVYFIRPIGMAGPVKIGRSYDPEGRKYNLNTWAAFPLEVWAQAPGGSTEEQKLHAGLFPSHSHGEWFKYTDELGEIVQRVVAGEPLERIVADLEPKGSIHTKTWKPWPAWLRQSQSARVRVQAARKRTGKAIPEEIWGLIEAAKGARRELSPEENALIDAFCSASSIPSLTPMEEVE